MTGIERLRDIVDDGPYSGGMIHISVHKLREIYEQIEGEIYDISGYESDVLAFVEEKGGLDALKKQFKASDRSYDRKTFYDRLALGWIVENGGLDAVKERTMPEGMSWPRYKDDEPVRVGDEVVDEAEELVYRVSEIAFSDGYGTCLRYEDQRDGNSCNFIDGLEPGKRVKRPAPKVLDADGEEIYKGRIAYGTRGRKYRVTELYEYEPSIVHAQAIDDGELGDEFIAANTGLNSYQLDASKLTHTKPEPPDSWERLEEDARMSPSNYCLARGLEGTGATYGKRVRVIVEVEQ